MTIPEFLDELRRAKFAWQIPLHETRFGLRFYVERGGINDVCCPLTFVALTKTGDFHNIICGLSAASSIGLSETDAFTVIHAADRPRTKIEYDVRDAMLVACTI